MVGTMSVSDVRAGFSDLLNRVAYHGEQVVIERNRKRVAVLLSVDEYERLLELEDMLDIQAAREAKREHVESGAPATPLEDVAAELGIELPTR